MGYQDAAADLIYDIQISSVVPATVTGEIAVHEFTGMDLAMKLHYLRTVYFYDKEAVEGVDINFLKKAMFWWLDVYCSVSGRIRKSEQGRPFIKCNDAGVRIIEAQCRKRVDEWVEEGEKDMHKLLVSNQVLGPVLDFSPLVFLQLLSHIYIYIYVQFTWFKCGGLSIGFSWSHVLGDAFTATIFINTLGHFLSLGGGKEPPPLSSLFLPRTKLPTPAKSTRKPLSAKRIEPVGNHWLAPANTSKKMGTFSFHFNGAQTKRLVSKISDECPPFDAISALIWRLIAQAKGRGEEEPRVVTICRNATEGKGQGMLSNKQVITTVKTDLRVGGAQLSEVAALILAGGGDESEEIEAMVEMEHGLGDFLVYGANLTFVDLGDSELYGMEVKGKKPVHVSFRVDGVGDEGAVFVHRAPNNINGVEEEDGGRLVTAVLPENEVSKLREELKRWNVE